MSECTNDSRNLRTVKDLIKLLETQNPSLPIYILDNNGNSRPIEDVGIQYDKLVICGLSFTKGR